MQPYNDTKLGALTICANPEIEVSCSAKDVMGLDFRVPSQCLWALSTFPETFPLHVSRPSVLASDLPQYFDHGSLDIEYAPIVGARQFTRTVSHTVLAILYPVPQARMQQFAATSTDIEASGQDLPGGFEAARVGLNQSQGTRGSRGGG